MADGGEAWNKHYLGSNDGTTASTRCRRVRRSCWREELENEAWEEEEIAGGATAALGGEAHCARKELLWLAECGMLSSDSLNAELRWRDIGAARVLAVAQSTRALSSPPARVDWATASKLGRGEGG